MVAAGDDKAAAMQRSECFRERHFARPGEELPQFGLLCAGNRAAAADHQFLRPDFHPAVGGVALDDFGIGTVIHPGAVGKTASAGGT
ncbi:hypothetical protein SDC9_174892 [bioreactor metagenome]|uniref:Uncharacterized protein n=1 Tax=bioreactor metagenome TaxID=1076179 RepID=A0A645GNH8_9ZZZZ